MADEKELQENQDFEEYEPQIVELDGEPFEVIDGICYDEQNYVALVPFTEDDELEGEDVEFIILKAEEQGDELVLSTVDDDALYDEIGEAFIEHLNTMFGDEHDDGCDCDDCNQDWQYLPDKFGYF